MDFNFEIQEALGEGRQRQTAKKRRKLLGMSYIIDENPPWSLCIVLAFQQYLTMLGGVLAVPFILAQPMCFQNNFLATSEILSTMFFVSGIATILQSVFGVRLPIIQGSSFTFLAPIFAILSLPKWRCPSEMQGMTNATLNTTQVSSLDDDIWKPRMREIQGAIIVSSLFEVVIGFSGMIGFFLRFIGPLSISPTISLVGLSLFPVAARRAGTHWGISSMTVILIALFSQYMFNVKIPIPVYNKQRGCFIAHYPVFKLFPIILAIAVSWGICGIITAAGGFPSDPNSPQYLAQTDARTSVLKEADWFRFPYPGQWGMPTVSAAGVFGMLAGVLASIIESVGDYYACARIAGAPPPPRHAVNRGIGMEGIGVLLTGIWGCGSGTASYSENIGAIGITKVGSLRVVQFGGVLLMVIGVLGKIGALFTAIPDPIVGGVFLVMFGMISAVGVGNLQYVDLNSSRNLFIAGFSLMIGLALPHYLTNHPDAIQTGVPELDQIITVLLQTHMAVGGLAGFILDNTVPGSPEERGLVAWRKQVSSEQGSETEMRASYTIYNLPFGGQRLSKYKVAKYLPFIPYKPQNNAARILNKETKPTVPGLKSNQPGEGSWPGTFSQNRS